jgi:hypothetical protein
MRIRREATGGLDGMSEGMAEVENGPYAGFMLVHRHHICLNLAAITNHPRQQRGLLQEPRGRAALKQLE